MASASRLAGVQVREGSADSPVCRSQVADRVVYPVTVLDLVNFDGCATLPDAEREAVRREGGIDPSLETSAGTAGHLRRVISYHFAILHVLQPSCKPYF